MGVPSITVISIIDGNTVDVVASEPLLQDANFYLAPHWVITGGAATRVVSLVASPNTNTARLTFSPEMLTGETLTITPDVSIVSQTTGDSFIPPSESWAASGDKPSVASALALTFNVIRVTFDEGMLIDDDLNDVASYALTPDIGGTTAVVTSVTPEGASEPTYVDLQLSAELTDGINYEVEVSTDVKDAVGNTLNSANTKATFVGIGIKPQLTGVQILSEGRRVRLLFNEPMRRDGALASPANYQFNVITIGAAAVYIESISVPDDTPNPMHVDVLCSEMTIGASYEVVVSDTGPTDLAANTMDPVVNTVAFVGVGVSPLVTAVEAISQNRADVVFSETMRGNPDIREVSRYTWDNGLETISVLDVAQNTVKLVTSDQQPGVLYNLTIDPT
jgi:hypothetical protein